MEIETYIFIILYVSASPLYNILKLYLVLNPKIVSEKIFYKIKYIYILFTCLIRETKTRVNLREYDFPPFSCLNHFVFHIFSQKNRIVVLHWNICWALMETSWHRAAIDNSWIFFLVLRNVFYFLFKIKKLFKSFLEK